MTHNTTENFGQALRQLRESVGIGLSEMARRTGLARSHLYRLEAGESQAPSTETLNALADALGVEAEDLYDLAWKTIGSGPGLPTAATYFRAKYELDDDQIRAVERTLQRVTQTDR
jgi:transcriptional regulator with XRE-family HTH domain